MGQARSAALVSFVLAACSPSDSSIGTPARPGGGSGGNGAGGAGGGSASPYAPNSFYLACAGDSTTLSGTAVAPNGTDPISGAEISVWDHVPAPLGRGVVCESCTAEVSDKPLLTAIAAADGTFSLSLDTLKKRANYIVTVKKARFRRVLPGVNLEACGATVLTPAQAALPKNTTEGDVPKIAISSGNRDHLEKVVDAMGITGYDCFKGLPASSTTDTCMASRTLGDLVSNPNLLDQYGLLFVSCAVSNPFSPMSQDDSRAKNLRAWVERGGKLVVTDDSYDFVEQTFPDAIDFQGAAAASGRAQAVDAAEVGSAVDTVTGVVNDEGLAAWLKLFPSAIDAAKQVALHGFLAKWAVQRAPGPGTQVVVHGQAPFSNASADVPLTSRFEVKGCGRVIYSSYHTDSSGTLLPQERILEYLMFEVAACTSALN